MMVTLKQARDEDRLDQFITEREAENMAPGDKSKFKRTLAAMAQKSKAVPATSKPVRSDD